jgi:imidazolonepropionase-like amidohydrolase
MTHTIITNAQLFDTKAGELVGERHVLVEEGRIKEVSDKPIAASEARVIDARGRTLMPGLCDAHVHVVAGSANVALVESWSPYYRAAKAAEILNGMLMRGFTTVRDAGGPIGTWPRPSTRT